MHFKLIAAILTGFTGFTLCRALIKLLKLLDFVFSPFVFVCKVCLPAESIDKAFRVDRHVKGLFTLVFFSELVDNFQLKSAFDFHLFYAAKVVVSLL